MGLLLSGLCLVTERRTIARYRRRAGVPVLLLLIPIFDTTFVTVTRLITGPAGVRGGRDHTSHRLVALGISERRGRVTLRGGDRVGAARERSVPLWRHGHDRPPRAAPGRHDPLRRPSEPGWGGARRRPTRRRARSCGSTAELPFKRQTVKVLRDLVLIPSPTTAPTLALRGSVRNLSRRVREDDRPGHRAADRVFGGVRRVPRAVALHERAGTSSGSSRGSRWEPSRRWPTWRLQTRFEELSRAVFVLDWLLLVLLVCGSRAVLPHARGALRRAGQRRPARPRSTGPATAGT